MTEEFGIKSNQVHVKIHAANLDEAAKQQVYRLAKHPSVQGLIAMMPDAHYGKGCVIGTTCHFAGGVIPNVVGVDIGCGVMGYPVGSIDISFEELDKRIRKTIPLGFEHRSEREGEDLVEKLGFGSMRRRVDEVCEVIDYSKSVFSQLGTLGGGNHFIEIGETDDEENWIFVHSGSRNFGLKIATYYQTMAKQLCQKMKINVPNDMEYLPTGRGEAGSDYLYHMGIAQNFAHANRLAMIKLILDAIDRPFHETDVVDSVHNFISPKDNICRKGAISAYLGEDVLIPLNMADGTIIGKGKGNKDYNYSAPHGAGRLFGRNEMKRQLLTSTSIMEEFKTKMKGVYSTSINENTIDESPMAYKPFSMIGEHLEETVTIVDIAKPVYNLKG